MVAGGVSQDWLSIRLMNFEGGLNTAYSLHALLENEVADIQNLHLEARGGIIKREGYSTWVDADSATGDPIVGLWQYRNATDDYLIRVEGGDISQSTGGGWTDITGAETITTTQDVRPVFATYRGSFILTNGVDIPLKWDGTGDVTKINQDFDGVNDITKAATLTLHNEQIVLGDVTTDEATSTRYESAIWASDEGTLDSWIDPAGEDGRLHIQRGDGESITCLLDVMGYLVCFKQNSLHRVSGFGGPNVSRVRVSGSVGTPGPHSAIVVGTFVYFIDSSGRFWAYDPRGTNEDSLVELSRDKLGTDTFDTFVLSRNAQIWTLFDPVRNEVHWNLTEISGSETNAGYVYRLGGTREASGFTVFRYTDNFNCGAKIVNANNEPEFVVGTYGGDVHKLYDGTFNDDGVSYETYVVLRDIDMDAMEIHKQYRYLHLYTRIEQSQNIVLTQFSNFEEAGTETPIALTGGGDVLG